MKWENCVLYEAGHTISPRLAPDLWGGGGGDREGMDKGTLEVSTLIVGSGGEADFEANSALSWRSLSVAAVSRAFRVSIWETSSLSECEVVVLSWVSASSLAFSCSNCATRLKKKGRIAEYRPTCK